MMNVDRLIHEAQRLMETGEYEEAKSCLKRAAAQAPLRADIREMLEEVLELGPSSRPSANPWRGAGPRSLGRQSPSAPRSNVPVLKIVLAAVAVLCLAGLGAVGVFIAQNWSGASDLLNRLQGGGNTTGTLTSPALPDNGASASLLAPIEELVQAEKYKEALAAIETALTSAAPADKVLLEKRRTEIQVEYGKKVLQTNPEEAVTHLEGALKADPSNAETQLSLGWAYLKKAKSESGALAKADYKSAEEALNKAVEMDSKLSQQAWMLVSQVKIAQDKQIEGARYLRKVIETDPQSSYADQARKQLEMSGMR